MSFNIKEIKSEIIWIIDIWTYKIRVWICEFKNWELELIWYWEKRQDINAWIKDPHELSNTIKSAIYKAEKKAWLKTNDIIINVSFKETYFNYSKFNYPRKTNEEIIWKTELEKIIWDIEETCIKSSIKKINNKYSYNKEDLQLIASNINKIKIDWIETKKILRQKAKEVNISLLNIFTTKESYNSIQYIWNLLDKKILKILPTELSITKLFPEKKDLVIIDLWNSHLSIIVKLRWNIIWVSKIALWISSLIEKIQKKENKPKIEIIDSIDKDLYNEEKKEFLEVFKECLIVWLEDILWDEIWPNNFFILWWWNNNFIKEYIKNTNFSKENLKILSNIKIIEPNIDYLKNFYDKSNINIVSMMISTLEFIKNKKDPINISLEKVIEKLDI